jgi:hypothetical protein
MADIRFDLADFPFVESDFEIKPPKEYAELSYRPITSSIKYKGKPCVIRFPIQYGYGLNEIKKKEDDKEKIYSFTYIKREEKEEEKRFVKFMSDFESWYKSSVTKIAKTQVSLQKNKQPSVLAKKLANELSEHPELIKPFFCYPKNPDTKELDKTKDLRHYVKFKATPTGRLDCNIHNLTDVHKELASDDIISTDSDKKTGDYVLLVRFKGVFYKSSEDYCAMLQTVGKAICYRKSESYNPLDLMGSDYIKLSNGDKVSDEDEEEQGDDDDDTVLEKNMLKKLRM